MATVQLLRGTSVTVVETFQGSSGPVDLDSGVPTITALYPDGSALTPAPTASHVGAVGSGQYQIVLDAQPEVTVLKLTWVGMIGARQQTLKSRVEWIGELLFNVADLRALKVADRTPFASTTDYPDKAIYARRTEVTLDFEQRCGWSFVPRHAREVHDGGGQDALMLGNLKAHTLLSVTIDGVAQTLSDFELLPSGLLVWKTGGWFSSASRRNVAVQYVHGFEQPPPAVSSAAMARAAMLLLPSLGSSTASSWTTPDGTTYQYDQAGQRLAGGGIRHYGVAAIDSCLNEYAGGKLAVA
jgi:hypothetical protein